MIADRFLDSIVAYQGNFLPSFEPDDVEGLECITAGLLRRIGIPIPDRTYLLDVSTKLSAERFARREGRSMTDFELAQLTRIRTSLLTLARTNPRFLVIDAARPLDDVVGTVLADLNTRLAGTHPT
jgi:thymidylate kinase